MNKPAAVDVATSGTDDRLHDPLDLGRGARGDENMMAFGRKTAASCCAQSLFGADAEQSAHRLSRAER
jgi:hypothetical protein